MQRPVIYQIVYNDEVIPNLDPGFARLDNTKNLRPDWREYWPIRNYLKNSTLDESIYYGFFSPKFSEKTGLSSSEVYSFVESVPDFYDVILFSPFFDLSAFFRNTLIHCISQHPNSLNAVLWAVGKLATSTNINKIVTHSQNNVYCNYFVARPSFWLEWFNYCEVVWSEAERGEGEISAALKSAAIGHTSDAPVKTFIIERMASLILSTTDRWRATSFSPLDLPFSSSKLASQRNSLIRMDALKIAYCQTKWQAYLDEHDRLVTEVLDKINS